MAVGLWFIYNSRAPSACMDSQLSLSVITRALRPGVTLQICWDLAYSVCMDGLFQEVNTQQYDRLICCDK